MFAIRKFIRKILGSKKKEFIERVDKITKNVKPLEKSSLINNMRIAGRNMENAFIKFRRTTVDFLSKRGFVGRRLIEDVKTFKEDLIDRRTKDLILELSYNNDEFKANLDIFDKSTTDSIAKYFVFESLRSDILGSSLTKGEKRESIGFIYKALGIDKNILKSSARKVGPKTSQMVRESQLDDGKKKYVGTLKILIKVLMSDGSNVIKEYYDTINLNITEPMSRSEVTELKDTEMEELKDKWIERSEGLQFYEGKIIGYDVIGSKSSDVLLDSWLGLDAQIVNNSDNILEYDIYGRLDEDLKRRYKEYKFKGCLQLFLSKYHLNRNTGKPMFNLNYYHEIFGKEGVYLYKFMRWAEENGYTYYICNEILDLLFYYISPVRKCKSLIMCVNNDHVYPITDDYIRRSVVLKARKGRKRYYKVESKKNAAIDTEKDFTEDFKKDIKNGQIRRHKIIDGKLIEYNSYRTVPYSVEKCNEALKLLKSERKSYFSLINDWICNEDLSMVRPDIRNYINNLPKGGNNTIFISYEEFKRYKKEGYSMYEVDKNWSYLSILIKDITIPYYFPCDHFYHYDNEEIITFYYYYIKIDFVGFVDNMYYGTFVKYLLDNNIINKSDIVSYYKPSSTTKLRSLNEIKKVLFEGKDSRTITNLLVGTSRKSSTDKIRSQVTRSKKTMYNALMKYDAILTRLNIYDKFKDLSDDVYSIRYEHKKTYFRSLQFLYYTIIDLQGICLLDMLSKVKKAGGKIFRLRSDAVYFFHADKDLKNVQGLRFYNNKDNGKEYVKHYKLVKKNFDFPEVHKINKYPYGYPQHSFYKKMSYDNVMNEGRGGSGKSYDLKKNSSEDVDKVAYTNVASNNLGSNKTINKRFGNVTKIMDINSIRVPKELIVDEVYYMPPKVLQFLAVLSEKGCQIKGAGSIEQKKMSWLIPNGRETIINMVNYIFGKKKMFTRQYRYDEKLDDIAKRHAIHELKKVIKGTDIYTEKHRHFTYRKCIASKINMKYMINLLDRVPNAPYICTKKCVKKEYISGKIYKYSDIKIMEDVDIYFMLAYALNIDKYQGGQIDIDKTVVIHDVEYMDIKRPKNIRFCKTEKKKKELIENIKERCNLAITRARKYDQVFIV